MPEEHLESEDSAWLVEPPDAGDVHLHIAVGSEVELSPEARTAIETLIGHIQDSEVMGFIPPCGALEDCTRYRCTLGKCKPLKNDPCRANVTCKVAEFF